MCDAQIDRLREIESIAQLLQIAQESEQLDGATLQRIGDQILSKCQMIESVENADA